MKIMGKFHGSARNSVVCGKLYALIMTYSEVCFYIYWFLWTVYILQMMHDSEYDIEIFVSELKCCMWIRPGSDLKF